MYRLRGLITLSSLSPLTHMPWITLRKYLHLPRVWIWGTMTNPKVRQCEVPRLVGPTVRDLVKFKRPLNQMGMNVFHPKGDIPKGVKSCGNNRSTMQYTWSLAFISFLVKAHFQEVSEEERMNLNARVTCKYTCKAYSLAQPETPNAFYITHLAVAQSPRKSMKDFPLNSVRFGSCLLFPNYLLPKARNHWHFLWMLSA